MKDDAPPQNPGMCLQYTHRRGCTPRLHAKDVFKGACPAMDFLMHINAAQNIKQILLNQSGLAFFLAITCLCTVTTKEEQRFYLLRVLSKRSDTYAFTRMLAKATACRPTYLASRIEPHLSFAVCCLGGQLLFNSDVVAQRRVHARARSVATPPEG